MAVTLAHEVAHTFGFLDEEGYDRPGHDQPGWNCVMEKYDTYGSIEFYYQVLAGEANAFCPSCEALMREYINDAIE